MTPKSNMQFDLDKALEELRAGKPMSSKDGFLTLLIKQLTEAALQAEQEAHIDQDSAPKRKNDCSSRTIKSPAGNFERNTKNGVLQSSKHANTRSSKQGCIRALAIAALSILNNKQCSMSILSGEDHRLFRCRSKTGRLS